MRSFFSIRLGFITIVTCMVSMAMPGCGGFDDQLLPPEPIDRFSIVGRIMGNGVTPDGVIITIPELSRQATSNPSGWFEFKDVPVGSYTLIPVKGSWIFSPSSLGILLRKGDDSSARFAAEPSIMMITIPEGKFTMGSNDLQYPAEEHPEHEVTVSSFMIGEYEVTQRQWTRIMTTNPSAFRGDNNPVEKVSWYDAIRFCNELSKQENLDTVYAINGTIVTFNRNATGYRLPTEAEWEHACRAGTTTRYYNGDKRINLDETAWHSGNSGMRSHLVGQLSPNPFGLYDMLGNVIEWCWDWAGDSYPSGAQVNPIGNPTGTMRIARGGSWAVDSAQHRATYRMRFSPNSKVNSLGFRVARSIR